MPIYAAKEYRANLSKEYRANLLSLRAMPFNGTLDSPGTILVPGFTHYDMQSQFRPRN